MTRTTLVGLAKTESVRAKQEKREKKEVMEIKEKKFEEWSKINLRPAAFVANPKPLLANSEGLPTLVEYRKTVSDRKL
jgi:hypothetical protein